MEQLLDQEPESYVRSRQMRGASVWKTGCSVDEQCCENGDVGGEKRGIWGRVREVMGAMFVFKAKRKGETSPVCALARW